MGVLRLILGDQLSPDIAALQGACRERDVILMAEVRQEACYVRHHRRKIVFLFSAMRHFAAQLAGQGYTVRYVRFDDEENTGSLMGEVARCLASNTCLSSVTVTSPGEWRLLEEMRGWQAALGRPVEICEDARFIVSPGEFAAWAGSRRQLRMEYFYREVRKRTGLLMEDGEPAGGQWNYDMENRRSLPGSITPPQRFLPPADPVTAEVIELVSRHFPDRFGDLSEWNLATTRSGAEAARDHFIAHILPGFGDWQDAMAEGQPWLWHSLLSAYLNCGLLDPLDVCVRAEAEWRAGRAPINAVEGFIRQIIGWREFVRGIYWLRMPSYSTLNFFAAERTLPDFYWTGHTDMHCMSQAIGQTRRFAYAHHIQRLMVTGNFALIAGVHPDEVDEWYLSVYADAYEWVEMPNTRGMALHADGGIMASKPYAASGNYISRMSDYCRGCPYDVKKRSGPGACPFNFLYWDFISRHAATLRKNPRMSLICKSLERISAPEMAAIRAQATEFLDRTAPLRDCSLPEG